MTPQQWVAARLPAGVAHLDAAACGRVSAAALDAEVAHLRDEAARGGYVAEADADDGRDDLSALLGGALVAWSDSAATAFSTLLAAWPLERGARVGTVTSDYGGNALSLAALARARGWELVPLPVDPLGRVTDVPAGLDLVTFPQVASQRGVAQPVQDVLGRGVPLVLDVAQSLGQTPVPPGCAAYVGTSRKWLCGPRGVGFLAVDPALEPLLASPPVLVREGGVRRFDSQEAHVAGRAGLGVAVREWSPDLLPLVHARAAQVRTALAAHGVVEPVDEPTGITTLRVDDPVAARARLLDRGLLVSAVPTSRSADLDAPVLRVSTHAWVTDADVDALASAL